MTPPKPVRVDKDILRSYEGLIESLRTSESRDPAANRYPWQCEAALKQLADFSIAKQQQALTSGGRIIVRLRTDSFPSRIYAGPVGQHLHTLLEKGGELRILLTVGDANYDLPSLKRFARYESFCVKQESSPSTEFRNHFFVVAEQAYRYEAPHGDFTGAEFRHDDDFHPEIPARICFNDVRGAKTLTQLFDNLWDLARVLPAVAEGDKCESGPGKSTGKSTLAS